MDVYREYLEEKGKEVKICHNEELQEELLKQFPEGLSIFLRDESVANLKDYAKGAQMDDLVGHVGEPFDMLKVYGDLKTEIKLPVTMYNRIYADDETYYSQELSEKDYYSDANATTMLMAEAEEKGTLKGMRMKLLMHGDTEQLLQHLYIEDRPFAEVASMIEKHNIQTDNELKQIMALQKLYKQGLAVDEDIPEIVRPVMRSVEEDMQHMYGGKYSFREHPYYESDIHHKFSKALQLKAEVELMKQGVLPLEKHNLVVQFSNTRGDNWEAKWMEDHYVRNEQHSCQVVRIGDRLVFSIETMDAQKQVDIRDGLECSWAQKGVYRMPYEPLKDKAAYIITGEGQALKGYICCEQFTENNYQMKMSQADGTMSWRWVHAHGGDKYNNLQTEEKLYFNNNDRMAIERMVRAEKIEKDLDRITNATIYNNPQGTMCIRCKVDGVQQMGKPLANYVARIVNTAKNNEQLFNGDNLQQITKILAHEYFSQELKRDENRTLKR